MFKNFKRFKHNALIIVLIISFISINVNYIYRSVKAEDGYWQNQQDQNKEEHGSTSKPPSEYNPDAGVIGDTSDPTGEADTPYDKNNKDEENKDEENSDFKPIDTSGMNKKNPPSGEDADIVTQNITKEGQGGNDTSSNGLAELAVFGRSNKTIENLFGLLKKICNIVLGLALVFGLASIVVLVIQLGMHSSNPKARGDIMHKLMIVGIATAVSTSMSVFFNFFINLLTRQ